MNILEILELKHFIEYVWFKSIPKQYYITRTVMVTYHVQQQPP